MIHQRLFTFWCVAIVMLIWAAGLGDYLCTIWQPYGRPQHQSDPKQTSRSCAAFARSIRTVEANPVGGALVVIKRWWRV